MHLRTALLLALVLGGLALVYFWQVGREESGAFSAERPFLEGVAPGEVVRVYVDNLERGLQMTLERDEDGRWWIVDPIRYPAEAAVVELLLESLTSQTGFAVPAPDLAGLELDPPRVVVKLERVAGGARTTHRIELGAVDLDQQHVFARLDGEVFKVLRTLDTALERDLPDWRSRYIFPPLRPYSLVELRRAGSARLTLDEEPLVVDLRAVNEDGWIASEPWGVRLDPDKIIRLLQSICLLRAAAFVDDAPGDLSPYGLDPAPVTIELEAADGRREVLRLAPPRHGEQWLAALESSPHVYAISFEDMVLLCTPLDLLADREVARFSRDQVERVELEGAGRVISLRPRGRDWLLSVAGEGLSITDVRADPERVADLLTTRERARILALLPDVSFEPRAERTSLRIHTGGRALGGELGAEHVTADGGSGVLFRREGDTLTALVDAKLLALATSAPDTLRSRELVAVPEVDLVRIDLAAGEEERSFVRQPTGLWTREGTEVEATAFAVLVDRLLAVRALEHYPGGAPVPVVDPVTVRLVRGRGQPVVYELGLREGGAGVFTAGGEQARVDPGLHAELLRLLGGG